MTEEQAVDIDEIPHGREIEFYLEEHEKRKKGEGRIMNDELIQIGYLIVRESEMAAIKLSEETLIGASSETVWVADIHLKSRQSVSVQDIDPKIFNPWIHTILKSASYNEQDKENE